MYRSHGGGQKSAEIRVSTAGCGVTENGGDGNVAIAKK